MFNKKKDDKMSKQEAIQSAINDAILEAELQQLRHANEQSKQQRPRVGRVGHARVYEQKQTEAVRKAVRKADEAPATKGSGIRGAATRVRGARDGGRGMGRQTGRKQDTLPKDTAESDIMPYMSDLVLEPEDSS